MSSTPVIRFCLALTRPQPLYSLFFCVLFLNGNFVVGQDAIVPLGSPSQLLLERLQIQGRSPVSFHSSIKPYGREDVFAAAFHTADTGSALTAFELRYLLAENDEFYKDPAYQRTDTAFSRNIDSDRRKLILSPPESRMPILRFFYRQPAHFLAFDSDDFYLRVNPIIHFGLGSETDRDGLIFVNRRGVDIRGGLDQKVFFQTSIIEAQVRPGSYVKRFVEDYRALPDAGLYKDFESKVFNDEGAYDYLSSSGYVGFHVTKHIGMQLGHGKNFIGDGYRSLFLSDFAKNYFYLKFNTRVWRFHYQNIFAELSAREKLPGNVVVPKKYMAAHYLSFDVSPKFSVGLYEAVMFAREENGFELQYLNPVILYRSIEHHVGSPDNVFIGLSAKWDVWRSVRLYAQFILDEFKYNELFSSRKWWGNKNGIQLGAKYIDMLGIEDLDLLVEFNRVRPYTYSHYDSLGSYSHFNQPLAHPVGANFSEVLLRLDYRPLDRLWLNAKAFIIDGGDDTDEIYYGRNILRSNDDRTGEFGVAHGQGTPLHNRIVSFTASYMLKHNLFLEAQYFRRDFDSEVNADDLDTQYFMLGVRWNYFASQDEF